ncbi:MAG TPA: G5 domain-containing protein [Selenomonadales bacterium]|nr:G5 domain-containing protein [Selenomonadales bacterium]
MSGAQPSYLHKLRAAVDRRKAVLIAALVATSLVITGFVWAHKEVNIIADGQSVRMSTVYNQPEAVLAQANIKLGPNDEYRVSTPRLTNGSIIEVYRAVPVSIIRNNQPETIITGKPTVGELAESLGFSSQNSRLVPDGSTKIKPGMEIRVIHVTYNTVVRKETLPAPIVRKPDPSLELGEEASEQDGEDGVQEATVKLRLEDGQEAGAEVLDEKVIVPPKPQIVRVGNRDVVETSRGTMRFKRVYWMEATAYLPFDGSTHGITASGIPARRGIVAVDPEVIPLGSRVYVPGYGLALAADTGGAIIGNRIDLCMENSNEAWGFGRRGVKVYLID